MKVVALLPMKGNSVRVPNKNLKNFNKNPLYFKILNTLIKSKYIKKIIVNTDSPMIKKSIQKNFKKKVDILNRPSRLCGDLISMNKIIEYDISRIKADIFLQTHSTNPLLSVSTIDNALEKMFEFLKKSKYDSIFSVTRIQKRFFDIDVKPILHDPNMLVTQDLKPIFEENSNFYIFTSDSYKKSSSRIGLKPYMYETSKIESIDIDDNEDFMIAEIIDKYL